MARMNERQVKINLSNEIYELKHPWPKDVFIQCGVGGLVLGENGSYRTAFLEAFPLNTFIRGESGKDNTLKINEDGNNDAYLTIAENKAWDKYQRFLACEKDGGHDYKRLRDDGYAECKGCGIRRSGVLDNIQKCWSCGVSPAYYEFSNPNSKERNICLSCLYEQIKDLSPVLMRDAIKHDGGENTRFMPNFYNENGSIYSEYQNMYVKDKFLIKFLFNEFNFDINSISKYDNSDFKSQMRKLRTVGEAGEEFLVRIVMKPKRGENINEDIENRQAAIDSMLESEELMNISFKIGNMLKDDEFRTIVLNKFNPEKKSDDVLDNKTNMLLLDFVSLINRASEIKE